MRDRHHSTLRTRDANACGSPVLVIGNRSGCRTGARFPEWGSAMVQAEKEKLRRRGTPASGVDPPALVESKLLAPSLRRTLVDRPRIRRALDGERHGSLALVVAPAGYGKTTEVRAWCASADAALAWVTLEKEDNDPALMWRYIATAVDRVREGLGRTALQRLSSVTASVEQAVDDLLNGAVGSSSPARDRAGRPSSGDERLVPALARARDRPPACQRATDPDQPDRPGADARACAGLRIARRGARRSSSRSRAMRCASFSSRGSTSTSGRRRSTSCSSARRAGPPLWCWQACGSRASSIRYRLFASSAAITGSLPTI